MQNHHKPPRPPPLSVSHPSDPTPPPAQFQTHSQPNPKPNLKPNRKPTTPTHSSSNSDESTHSPLRSDSPHRSDDHDLHKNGGAIVAVEKYYSPLTSPLPITPPKDAATPDNFSSPPHQVINFSRREEVAPQSGVVFRDGGGGGGGERKGRGGVGVRFGGVEDIVKKSRKGEVVEKVNLGIRVLEIVFCLISFSVMAANRTQGWSGDSFDRYKEYRFCLSVNVLGFIYAAFQAYDVANLLVTGTHVISHHLRYQFDFIMDQILAYLLISASSAAASRVDDWQANWGKDKFTEKASASVSMAFLAFLGFAMSSLISGYNLCTRDLS
ncbi:CASP-like protein 4A3 [Beta vulgaris subsp. vulgaris]|uniref:CASP-like protein 4A3 n=1 Tax=Beta vulgaris subsp. vulgaris TaxID=3555 RepID=UPI002036E1AB|nr:CASP-like protein 4A3 [Beta vulgaris subsp. vulgaris]